MRNKRDIYRQINAEINSFCYTLIKLKTTFTSQRKYNKSEMQALSPQKREENYVFTQLFV